MPDFAFRIESVKAADHGFTPLLQFQLHIANTPAGEQIQGAMLHAQVQLRPAQRRYSPSEKERLVEVFGTPERWGQTLRNRLWAQVDTTVPAFVGETGVTLSIPCTFDLNVAAAKYFHALDSGDVTVLFLFSGTTFFTAADGALQVQRISWEKECSFAFPASVWHELMNRHYPNSAWLYLQRDVFDRIYEYKRRHGLPTWDVTIEHLLAAAGTRAEVTA